MKKLGILVFVLAMVCGLWTVDCRSADKDKSLVLYYDFDQSGDAVKDASGSGIEGAVNGTVEWVNGVAGKAASFDGTSWVEVPYDERLGLGSAVTIVAWINPADYELDSYKSIIFLWDSYILRFDNPPEGGKFSFFAFLDGSPEPRVQMEAPALKKWHLVAGIWNGKKSTVWVDGQSTTADRTGTPAPKEGVIKIGDGYVGAMDELKVFNRALTEAELKAMLAAGPKAK